MIKINAGFSKKVPAEEQYSSEGYHCSLEVEVSDTVLNNPSTLKDKITGMFQEVRQNVEAQINGNGQTVNNGQSPHVNNGNGRASEKQKNFIVSLARRRHGMNTAELQEWVGTPVDELTKTQASELIEQLKNGKEKGRFDL